MNTILFCGLLKREGGAVQIVQIPLVELKNLQPGRLGVLCGTLSLHHCKRNRHGESSS